MEGIDRSAELADQLIMVEIDPNDEDEEPGFLCEDRVRVTVIKLEITEVDLPNDGVSFTTRDEPPGHVENEITLTANIEPDSFDVTYNLQIRWEIRDNPAVNGASPPLDISNLQGHEVTVEMNIPNDADGREYHPLNYRIQARFTTLEGTTVYSQWQPIQQDEIDMLRQQYIDMNKQTVPEREEFANAGQSTQGHFCIGCGNAGDGACQCGHHEYHLWSIMDNLEDVFTNLNQELGPDVQIQELRINSGYRCPIRNVNINPPGALNSEHIYGTAADVDFEDWDNDGSSADDKQALIKAAEGTGARVRSNYPGHVHMDW